MLLKPHTVTLLLFWICASGAAIFAAGYFPLTFSDNGRASRDDLPVDVDGVE